MATVAALKGTIIKTDETRTPHYQSVLSSYIATQALIERMHRRLLDVIKAELDRNNLSDVNPIQAMLLYNIDQQEMSVSDLRLRGCYLGTNVSYNLKKLVDDGFIASNRSRIDRRSVRIKLTERGRAVRAIVHNLFETHAQAMQEIDEVKNGDLAVIIKSLKRLERFWRDQVMYQL